MHPILFTIGKLNISSYTVLLDLGLILALVAGLPARASGSWAASEATWRARRRWTPACGPSSAASWAGGSALCSATWRCLARDWVRALRIWEGGLSFHGAFLGGLAALILVAFLQSRSARHTGLLSYVLKLSDTLTLSLAAGLVFGWIACLLGGCVYGASGQGIGYAVLPDLYGVEASRFATQAVGAGLTLLLLAIFWLLRRRWPFPGAALLMLLLLYFTGVFFLEFTRGDEAIYVSGWRLAQIIDLALVVLAAAGLLALWWRAGTGPEEEDETEAEIVEEAERDRRADRAACGA